MTISKRKAQRGATIVEYTLLLVVSSATCVGFFKKLTAGIAQATNKFDAVLSSKPVVEATVQTAGASFPNLNLLWFIIGFAMLYFAVSACKQRA